MPGHILATEHTVYGTVGTIMGTSRCSPQIREYMSQIFSIVFFMEAAVDREASLCK